MSRIKTWIGTDEKLEPLSEFLSLSEAEVRNLARKTSGAYAECQRKTGAVKLWALAVGSVKGRCILYAIPIASLETLEDDLVKAWPRALVLAVGWLAFRDLEFQYNVEIFDQIAEATPFKAPDLDEALKALMEGAVEDCFAGKRLVTVEL